mmetsp:Transcript_29371/g.73708  ORF Transcript_29371/g.73708 Transcript_29371/m.73708 type:complete len:102 (-) Transcript_29371:171-476(-)
MCSFTALLSLTSTQSSSARTTYPVPLAKDFVQLAENITGRSFDVVFMYDGAPTPAEEETEQSRKLSRRCSAKAQKLTRSSCGQPFRLSGLQWRQSSASCKG